MRALYLVRHGQSVSNAVRRFQGMQDVPLSELGRRQAEALAGALRGRRIAAVYSSPLQRARHTAELAAAMRDLLTRAARLSIGPPLHRSFSVAE